MKTKLLLLLTTLALATSGCVQTRYTTTEKDGRQTSFSAFAFGANKVVKDLSVGGNTSTTTRGLKIGLESTDVSTPIEAAANAVSKAAEALAAGAAKGLK